MPSSSFDTSAAFSWRTVASQLGCASVGSTPPEDVRSETSDTGSDAGTDAATCNVSGPALGSCSLPSINECHQYSGSGWTEEGVKGSCDMFASSPCTKAKLVGRCLIRCGAPNELLVFFYEGAPAPSTKCTAMGGSYEPVM